MPDKDILYNLYVIEQKTAKEIATMYGKRSPETVCNWLRKYSIPIRQGREAQRPAEPTREELYDLYEVQGKSLDAIARLLGSSEYSITKLLRQYDIPIHDNPPPGGWNKGQALPDEQKRTLSEYAKQRTGPKSARYGVTLEPETRAKISQSLVGRFRKHLHPNWKDGGTTRYRRILSGQAEYDQWRRAVFARDNYTCQMCGKPSNGDIQAHHIHPVRSCPERIMDLDNGITLCELCHDAIRLKEAEYIERFEAIIRQSTP